MIPKTETSQFVTSLVEVSLDAKATFLHIRARECGQAVKLLKEIVDAFKEAKAALAEEVEGRTHETRLAALNRPRADLAQHPTRMAQMFADAELLREAARELISQGYRLEALCNEEICGDWTETCLRASVEQVRA